MRNSVFRTVAMMRWVVVLACSCEDCAAATPIALAPTTATPIATAAMTNLLMLRGMTASTYRTIVVLYRRFDLRRCDLHHSFAFLAARVLRLPTPKPGAAYGEGALMKKFLASRGVRVPWVGGARPWPSPQALPCRG